MPGTTHLKSLQALEIAIRLGSLKAAAARLGITPAALGQRIRALEDHFGAQLLVRGRSGLRPTAQLEPALRHLETAFASLELATEALELERVSEIRIVADPDWSKLWLMPRLAAFRELHPNIRFGINGAGELPARSGAPDVRIYYGDGKHEPLFVDRLLPVSGPDNLRLFKNTGRKTQTMEGMPLLHLEAHFEEPDRPGWVEWFEKYGHRKKGRDRGVRFKETRLAIEAVRRDVGFLVCGVSFVQADLEHGRVFNLFSSALHLVAPHPYRMDLRHDAGRRPQLQRFVAWLRNEASDTRRYIEKLTGQP